jgi:hypothetical protein
VTAQQHVWFRPLLETIAKRRMASAPLGLKLRLGIGAGLSMADMVSDLYGIVNMLQTGQVMGAYGMIGLLGASLAMQLLVSILLTKHLGRNAIALEVFLVLSLVKPGFDALRRGAHRRRSGRPILRNAYLQGYRNSVRGRTRGGAASSCRPG